MRAALLADVAEVRVTSQTARVHFLACDRTGACAAVELVGGRQVVTTGEAMPWRVLTNSTYAESRAFTARRGGSALPAGAGSLERFARAAALSRAAADRDTGAPGLADDAFALLDSVSQGAGSVWNIVYDPVRLLVRFRTHAEPRVRLVELAALDFACAAGARVLDVDAERWGRVAPWLRPYSLAANRDLLQRVARARVVPLPAGAVDYLARFPEGLRCAP